MALFDLPLADLRSYRPDVPEPDDFDAFWKARVPAGPAVVEARPEPTRLRLVDTWDVTFTGFGGAPIRAWYTRPAGVGDALPAVVEYLGYGRGRGFPHERLTWVTAGYAHLLVDSRGQGDQYGSGGSTPDPHAGAPGGPGPVTRGIRTPEHYYYRRLIVDAACAVAAVRTLPGVDPARVAVCGNSQGGGLALAVAGLVPDLAAVLVSVPFLCHPQRAIEITDAAPYGEIVTFLSVHRDAEAAVRTTLSYVDGVNFARRATAPSHWAVGLRDTICPPSTVFAAFNHYGGTDRTIEVYPFNHHEGGDALHISRQLTWLADHLR